MTSFFRSRDGAPEAPSGRWCEPVPNRPPLKLARYGSETAALACQHANETKREKPIRPAAAAGAPLLYMGVPHAAGFTPMPERGGARNRADRSSDALSPSMARGLIEATGFAVRSGLPFNRMVTIHWEAGRVEDDLKATARFLKLAGDWVRRQGGVLAFLWVRENGPGKGRHVHILMHLPPDLARAFNRCQRRWLRACGAIWRAGVLLSRPVARSLSHALTGGPDYDANLAEALGYLLKGADGPAREAFGIRRREAGGSVVGKRCGVSVNIGPGMRAG